MRYHHNKIRCYSCREPVKGTLYIEREINPYAHVPLCERCAPTWHLLKDLERKKIIECTLGQGIRLTGKGRRMGEELARYGVDSVP